MMQKYFVIHVREADATAKQAARAVHFGLGWRREPERHNESDIFLLLLEKYFFFGKTLH